MMRKRRNGITYGPMPAVWLLWTEDVYIWFLGGRKIRTIPKPSGSTRARMAKLDGRERAI